MTSCRVAGQGECLARGSRVAATLRGSCAISVAALALLAASCAPPVSPSIAPPPPSEPTPRVDPRLPPATFDSAGADSLLPQRLSFAWPLLGAPRVDSLGRVDWSPRVYRSLPAGQVRMQLLGHRPDTLSAWRSIAAEREGLLRPYALRQVALRELAVGDTLAADSAFAALDSLDSPWGWEAVRTRYDFAVLAQAPGRAESLLTRANTAGWSDLDRSACLMRRATLAAERGDTARAGELAHQLLARFPALAPASSAIALLEGMAATRGRSLPLDDVLRAAESARLRGDRAEAVRRYQQAHAAAHGEARERIAVDLARALREARRFETGLATVTADLKSVADPALRARLQLERARLLRDAGRGAEAIRAYALLDAAATSVEVAGAAGWERAIELTTAARDSEARDASRVAERGGERASDARLMRGLLWISGGEPARALAEWGDAGGEGIEFWRAVLARSAGGDSAARVRADASLAAIAARPGYGFYRVAARDTLGVRGWSPASGASATIKCWHLPRELELARALMVLGDADAALLVLQRWSTSSAARPSAAADTADCPAAGALEAASIAAAAGRLPAAIRMAQRALDATPQVDSAQVWAITAWLYPPGQDSLYEAASDPPPADPIDRDLLRAVAWQESRFDPRARSKSDALGLYQLKLDTAGDMARRLGEPPPAREALFDPATSLRYGHEYLRWLLERLDAPWIVALSAYNSGPTPVGNRWRALRARGGDALFCELIGRAETRDYVRKILGARQAYRELRPYAGTPPVTPR